MSAFSNYLENAVLEHLFGGSAYTAPSTLYIALFTADDGLESGTITSEVSTSGTSYARVAIDPSTDMGTASAGSISNTAELLFTEATASWGTVTHAAIMDASTAGNVLVHGSLTSSKTVGSGDVARYAVGEFTITLD